MDLKDKIRQRRMDRIRSLRMKPPESGVFEPGNRSSRYETTVQRDWPFRRLEEQQGTTGEFSGTIAPQGDGPELLPVDDPEYVWRQREREWRQSWEEGRSSGGDGFRFMPTRRQIWVKLFLCAALYGLIALMYRSDSGWATEGKRYVSSALSHDMPFAAIEAWYRNTFSGAPSFIPTFHIGSGNGADRVAAPVHPFHTPVAGKLSAPYTAGHPLVELNTAAGAPVVAMDGGLVQFAGNRDGMGYTVTIQQAGGYVATYGGLQPGNWQKQMWVDAGDPIGRVASANGKTGTFYFSVMKDRQYVNPADVVSLD